MKVLVLEDANSVALRAAEMVAAEARAAIAARGKFTFAVSGGRTPWMMLRALAVQKIPWEAVHIFQVDERAAPDGDPDRNLTHLRESLRAQTSIHPEHIHTMPVEEPDRDTSAEQYAETLHKIAGSPAVLDLVHLGLGPDGHTASLVPGDPVLQITDRDVAWSGIYQGRRRMTLTYPILNRSRQVLWLATGQDKAEMAYRLNIGDTSIPAGHVCREQALLLVDHAAASQIYKQTPASSGV